MAEHPRSILAVKIGGIGDAVVVVPALRSLRSAFPAARIALLGRPVQEEILRGCPFVDEFLSEELLGSGNPLSALHPRFPGLLWRLRRGRFDAIVFLQHVASAGGALKYGVLARASGAPERIGLDTRGRGWFLTKKVQDEERPSVHEVATYLRVAEAAGARGGSSRTELWISGEERSRASEFLGPVEGPLVCLNPGGARASRWWPAERFARVADELAREFGAGIAILGGRAEKGLARRVAGMMKTRALDLAGRLSVRELAAAIDRADLLISNDTGAFHVAAALGRPTVGIFGPGEFKKWAEYGLGHVATARGDADCAPCYKRRCRRHICMESIETEQVLSAARGLLSGGGRDG